MRRVKFLPVLLIVFLLAACASETPWRKVTVTTFELTGLTIEHAKDTTLALRDQGLVTPEQVAKIRDVYNKAKAAHTAAGNALKLASAANSAISRDQFLAEYEKLLADFRKLAYEILALVDEITKKKR